MTQPYVEHANLTVRSLNDLSTLLLCAMPTWRIRGGGTRNWFGKEIRWLHVGSDSSYVALQDGGEGEHPDWKGSAVGTKHIGFVVPSLDSTLARLDSAGYQIDHWGGDHPFRRSVYVNAQEGVQFEFVEYLSDNLSNRNDYSR